MLLFNLPSLTHVRPKTPAVPSVKSTVATARRACIVTLRLDSGHRHNEAEVGGLDHYIDSRLGGERFHIV